jgi:hypothetical protein
MENWLFNRPKERQREKIVHDVFVSGCFSATSCAKNRDSSELRTHPLAYARGTVSDRPLAYARGVPIFVVMEARFPCLSAADCV